MKKAKYSIILVSYFQSELGIPLDADYECKSVYIEDNSRNARKHLFKYLPTALEYASQFGNDVYLCRLSATVYVNNDYLDIPVSHAEYIKMFARAEALVSVGTYKIVNIAK